MNQKKILVALSILFVVLFIVIFKDIDFGVNEEAFVIDETPDRYIYNYLMGEQIRTDLHRVVKKRELYLPEAFWDAFKVMDELIVKNRPQQAMKIRKRMSFMSDFIEQSLGRKGFLSLVTAHADVIREGDDQVLLDSDSFRANRRLYAIKGLEKFWAGESESGVKMSDNFPMLPVQELQTVEVAYALRLRNEILKKQQGLLGVDEVKDILSMLKWSEDHPGAVVLAEWALLYEEMSVSGYIDEDVEVVGEKILKTAIAALKGQAPQRLELLNLILGTGHWLGNKSDDLLYYACDYVEKLTEKIDGRLFRLAIKTLRLLGKDEKALAWLNAVEQSKNHLYGSALHVRALIMVDYKKSPKEIFAVFNQALQEVKEPKERADLMVDIGIYERELSKNPNDKTREYLKQAMVRFQEAIKLDEFHIAARLNLSTMSLRVNRFDFARTWLEGVDFRRATRHQSAVLHLNWTEIYVSERDFEKAKKHYDLAYELEPNLPGLEVIEKRIN